jgi:mRNA interferase RelE/StbE
MNYDIKYTKNCLKYLRRLDKKLQLKILKAINNLPNGDVKKLSSGEASLYRLRVGGYRAVFHKDVEKVIILIIKIGPRGDIYK